MADATRNMYGCTPCPRCGARYRTPEKKKGSDEIVIGCGDCGFVEPLDDDTRDAAGLREE